MPPGGDWLGYEDFFADVLGEDGYTIDDVTGIGLDFAGGEWSITVHTADFDYTVNIHEDDLPDWVWDDLYYEADDRDWEWDVSYDGEAA